MQKFTIVTAVALLFTGAGVYGQEENLLPVLGYQLEETRTIAMNNKRWIEMKQLYEMRVQLEKLKAELSQMDNPPRSLIDLRQYLEQEVDRLTKEDT